MMSKTKQLFLIHFAGGSSYSYQFLKPYLKNFEIICLELPGRGRRTESNLLFDFDNAVFDLYKNILLHLKASPFIIYGHSMGACLAFHLTNLLENHGTPPNYLFVTGSAGPKNKSDKKRYFLKEEDLINEIESLGGISDDILRDREFMHYYLPIIRADFELIEKSDLENENPISTPIFAFMGNEEEDHGRISQWQDYTKAQFDYEILEGNHFFIYRHAQYIASKINKIYENRTTDSQ